jgi:hypothetical protein
MLGRRRPSTTAHVRGQRRSNAMVSRSSFVANGRSRSNVGNMSSNVVSFRHSSRHAMSPSRRHDRRHVADMLPTRHAMSANEGLGRHFRLRHSLLRQGRPTFYHYNYYIGSDKLIQGRANNVSYKVSNSIDWVDNNSLRINYEKGWLGVSHTSNVYVWSQLITPLTPHKRVTNRLPQRFPILRTTYLN